MTLPLLLGSAAHVEVLLRGSLRRRFEAAFGRPLNQNALAWIAAVTGLHDVGSLLGVGSDRIFAGVVNTLRGRPSSLRTALQGWFGPNVDEATQVARSLMSFNGVCPEIASRATLPLDFEAALSTLTHRLSEGFAEASHPRIFEQGDGYAFLRLLAGVVALARQLASDSNEEEWGLIRARVARLHRELGLDPRYVPWPSGDSSTDPPGIRILEDRAETALHAIHWGASLIRAGAVDNIIIACRTRAAVLYVTSLLQNAFREIPIVCGLPWDVDPETGWFTAQQWRYPLAPICVTTQEQAFKAILTEQHANLRTAALARGLLVLDDVFLTDLRQRALVKVLIKHQTLLKGYTLVTAGVLSGHSRREVFLERWPQAPPYSEIEESRNDTAEHQAEMIAVPHPCVWRAACGGPIECTPLPAPTPWEVAFELHPPDSFVQRALNLARAGKRVVIFRNTLADCLRTVRTIEAIDPQAPLLRLRGESVILYTEYTAEDRHAIFEAAVQSRGPCIIVASAHVESRIPLRTNVVITDMCPVDVLLRRADTLTVGQGALIIGDQPINSNNIGPRGEARHGDHGIGSVYKDIFVLYGTRQVLLTMSQRGNALRLDRPRQIIEAALHPYHATCLLQNTDEGTAWERHAQWLASHPNAAIDALRWDSDQRPFGERDCDFQMGASPGEPRSAYIQNRPRIRIYFPTDTLSTLGLPMRVLVIDRIGDFHENQVVTPTRQGRGWIFGDGHRYNNHGYGREGRDTL